MAAGTASIFDIASGLADPKEINLAETRLDGKQPFVIQVDGFIPMNAGDGTESENLLLLVYTVVGTVYKKAIASDGTGEDITVLEFRSDDHFLKVRYDGQL